MEKDFDKWNNLKKIFEKEERKFFAHPREIWWCSLGVNLGAEIDGKNDNFERPVLVANVYSRETMLVLPITSKEKNDKFHYKIFVKNQNPAFAGFLGGRSHNTDYNSKSINAVKQN
jgi:mRNA interferase MazF